MTTPSSDSSELKRSSSPVTSCEDRIPPARVTIDHGVESCSEDEETLALCEATVEALLDSTDTGRHEVDDMSVRVLLAEHYPLIRQHLRRVLEEEPDLQVVAEASDSQQAIQMVEVHLPDVAIVDQRTPVNGIETTRRIRDCSPATQVVIYSVHSDDVYVTAALQAGAAAFVAADLADVDLVLAVRVALDGGFFAIVVVPPA